MTHFEEHLTESERLDRVALNGTMSVKRRSEDRRLKNELTLQSLLIAKRLRSILDALGMSQKDLAERIGVSPQQVSKLVRGSENLTIETLAKLKLALGYPIIQVVGQENHQLTMVEPDPEWTDTTTLVPNMQPSLTATQESGSAFDRADDSSFKVPA